MIYKTYRYLALLLFVLTNVNIGQQQNFYLHRSDTFKVSIENHYTLSAIYIVPFSEKITIGKKLLSAEDYKFNLPALSFSLSDSLQYSFFDTIVVSYKTIPIDLRKEYKHRTLVKKYDVILGDTISRVENKPVDLSSKAIFGKNLKTNGTLLRGFTVGTNKDLAVNSGLRLQLAGNISEDIKIVAALTDENTPIQPEGNTERLEELDKVFIQIKHKNASATFGDYNLQTKIGEFGKINRKLQGLSGKVNYNNYTGSFSVASSRGKFNSVSLSGIDGVQGPYRLKGVNNENDIIIIAGSEKVFLDGKQLKRGENNDYTIEYSNSEITFTPRIIITSLSRIIIDYEYTNRRYERNILGAGASANFFNNKLKIYFNALQEGDNKNTPIDISLSDNDKRILRNSGDDQLLAVTNGAILVEPDSNGNIRGIYSAKDTLYNGSPVKIFVFSPGTETAIYNVSFSYVGEGKGDYIRESIGKFQFAGFGQGAYQPIRLLPLPEKNQIGNFVVEYNPSEKIKLNVELAASSWDKNTFSNINDNDNNGYARNIKLSVKPLEIKLANTNLGKISGYFRDRFLDSKFKPIDRINKIEFNRDYNSVSTAAGNEILREVQLSYSPNREINISGQYGLLDKKNLFKSERYLSKLQWDNYKNININYNFDFVNTEAVNQTTNWYKQDGEISYNIWKLKPGFYFRSEDKKERLNANPLLSGNSLKYSEYAPFISLDLSSGFYLKAKYSLTKEEFPIDGILVKESESIAQTYSLNYRELKEFSTNLDFSLRNKKYTEPFKLKGFGDNEYIQIRSQSQLNLFNRFVTGTLYYQTSSERASKLEKVFIRVPAGTGSYSYQGDLNNNGIAEESEFIPDPFEGDFIQTTVPTDELFPVIDLKINSRWKLDFKRYFKQNNLISSVLKSLSTETVYRLEENSKISSPENIYLLNFKYFLNDSTTIRGSNYFQQDLHIFKNQRDLSFRFRFTQRRSLNQFSAGLEKSFIKEKGIRIKFRMVKEINNETEFINTIENVLAPTSSNRSRNTIANEIKSDFSYRPINNMEIGFFIKVGRLEDNYPKTPTIIDENKISLRLTLSLMQKGRVRVEIERTELVSNTKNNIIPFEITNGNLIGKNYIWRMNFDYRFTGNLQAKITYNGRLQGRGKVINTFSAEARAYF